jgi:hypothetical protein
VNFVKHDRHLTELLQAISCSLIGDSNYDIIRDEAAMLARWGPVFSHLTCTCLLFLLLACAQLLVVLVMHGGSAPCRAAYELCQGFRKSTSAAEAWTLSRQINVGARRQLAGWRSLHGVGWSVWSWAGRARGLSWSMKGPLAMNSCRRVNSAVIGFLGSVSCKELTCVGGVVSKFYADSWAGSLRL